MGGTDPLLARSPEDLLEGLSFAAPGRQAELFAPPEESPAIPPLAPFSIAASQARPAGPAGQVLNSMLEGARLTAEDVAGRLDKTVDQVLGAHLELENLAWVRREPGPVYQR